MHQWEHVLPHLAVMTLARLLAAESVGYDGTFGMAYALIYSRRPLSLPQEAVWGVDHLYQIMSIHPNILKRPSSPPAMAAVLAMI